MKILKAFSLTLLVVLAGCSGDDSPSSTDQPTDQYAMTGKFNGTLVNMRDPFGGNDATVTNWTDYPNDEFITLAGRPTNNWLNEMKLYIKRTDLHVGSYDFVREDFFLNKTFAEWIDNTNGNVFEQTRSGNITITEINTETKFVKGTFSLEVSDLDQEEIHTHVTEGTFNYYYDVED